MANKSKTMLEVKQIVSLFINGYSKREIASRVVVSRNTVRKYLTLIRSRGYSYVEFLKLDDTAIDNLLSDPGSTDHGQVQGLEQFFPYMEKELRRTGVNRWVLWEEYKRVHPSGYSYGRFCHLYRQWSKNTEVCMHMEHNAGDKLFVDYAGKKLSVVDRETGEVTMMEVFITTLGASQLTYAEASPSQQLEHFIASVERSLHYLGGVPRAIVPDNLKSAVTKANKYEPQVNKHFADFSRHYQTHILPTRAAKPQDKALVEKSVSFVYSRIYAPLRNRTFYSLSELNEAIWELLDKLNLARFQNRDYSRRELFEQTDKHALGPLPAERYHIKDYAVVSVQNNSHVYLTACRHYYSVPFRYIGKRVKVVHCSSSVEIYYRYERIALHRPGSKPYGYTSIKEHLPSTHRFISEWSPEKFINWARGYGENVEEYISKVLDNHQHPEQNYKSCMGILQLEKRYGKQRLSQACQRGLYYRNYGYMVIKNMLKKGLDRVKENDIQYQIPLHNNIRGGNYYK